MNVSVGTLSASGVAASGRRFGLRPKSETGGGGYQYVYIYICMYIYIYTCMYVFIYIYTHNSITNVNNTFEHILYIVNCYIYNIILSSS